MTAYKSCTKSLRNFYFSEMKSPLIQKLVDSVIFGFGRTVGARLAHMVMDHPIAALVTVGIVVLLMLFGGVK